MFIFWIPERMVDVLLHNICLYYKTVRILGRHIYLAVVFKHSLNNMIITINYDYII